MELTHRLIDEARDNGVRYLYGLVMRENRRMLHLLRDLGLPEQERREEGITRFEVCLQTE
jgi:L-amino acid N-acyltransferase YncA